MSRSILNRYFFGGWGLLVIFIILGCGAYLENLQPNGDLNPYAVESVDAFGYTLGLLAAKDPVLKEKIEHYYTELMEQGLTLATTNEALTYLVKSDDVAYKVLAYKLSRLVKLFGVQFDKDGLITDFGKFSERYLIIGKDAYLLGVSSGGAV
jgi:hypothetical protein